MSAIIDLDPAPRAEALAIVATLPAVPVVLADSDTMALVAELEAQAASVAKVTDAATDAAAWETLGRATRMAQQIEKTRTAVKAPFLELGRRIDDAAKQVATRIDAAKRTVQRGLDTYRAEQERIRQAEEARRLKEIEDAKRREREAVEKAWKEKQDAERLAREAEERARIANTPIVDVDFSELEAIAGPSQAEKELAEARAQVAMVASKPLAVAAPAKPASAQWRVTLKPILADVRRVPESMLRPREADMAKIRATYCTGWKDGDTIPTLEGIRFEVERTPIYSR